MADAAGLEHGAGGATGGPAVLVLAPRFPSINQPWMDTYLEQLGRAGLPFRVVSQLRRLGSYHDKVNQLGLLERRELFPGAPSELLKRSARNLVATRLTSLRQLGQAWAATRHELSTKHRVLSALRMAHARAVVEQDALRPDIIHSHSLEMGYDFLYAARAHDIPVVLTFHGLKPSGVPQVPTAQREALFHAAARVFVNTQFAADHAVELGCPAARIQILPQGLPLEDFPFCERAAPAAGETLHLLSVGRFHRDKGQGYSLLALRRLRDAGVLAHWHMAGVGPDLPSLKQRAERLGMSEHVTFHKAVLLPALRELYQRCHLFVLGSVDSSGGREPVETQGVVLQEAQASGCIPIATRVGGIPECLNDQVDSLLIEHRSHRALFAAIQVMVRQPERWSAMQRAGRQNVEARFSADVIGARMAAALREVVGGAAGGASEAAAGAYGVLPVARRLIPSKS